MTRKEKASESVQDATGVERSEAEKAIDEIDQAARMAEESLSITAGIAPAETITATSPDLVVLDPLRDSDFIRKPAQQVNENNGSDREDRVKSLIRRAALQKQRGRAELVKPYVGALSVQKTLKYFDVNIASSAERFLGLIDLSLYTITRRGPLVLGADACDEILARFDQMVTKYIDASHVAKVGSATAMKAEKDGSFGSEWLQPEYTQSAFECTIQAKHRLTTRLVDALSAWDTAIHDLSVLEWNGKVDAAQIAQVREEERRGLSSIYSFAAKSLVGMRNRTNKAPAKRPERPAESEAANSANVLAAA